jgi:hypothetical protein
MQLLITYYISHFVRIEIELVSAPLQLAGSLALAPTEGSVVSYIHVTYGLRNALEQRGSRRAMRYEMNLADAARGGGGDK